MGGGIKSDIGAGGGCLLLLVQTLPLGSIPSFLHDLVHVQP